MVPGTPGAGALEQRPAARLDGGAFRLRQVSDDLAPHFVERALGELSDMESVEVDVSEGHGLTHGLLVGGHLGSLALHQKRA